MQTTLNNFQSLVDAIQHWADTKPDHTVLRFYQNGESDPHELTYRQLDTTCRAIAQELLQHQGKTAVLIYQPGLDFLCAFFACLYAGVIAAPAYPPRKNHNMDRLSNILDDCKPALILSTGQQIEQSQSFCLEQFSDTHKKIPWVATDDMPLHLSDCWHKPEKPSDIAFLQYTSGSTGQPKGVMVSHNNLLANIQMAETHYRLPDNAHCISWLPLFHDMGLIGAVIMPVFWGTGSILMPPAAFLQKPKRFLDLLQRYSQQFPVGATQPNFAYQLLADQIEDKDLAGMDFSRWVFAMTGAEPVRADTLAAFSKKLQPYGFNPDIIKPAYGMAESTLLSTCRQQGPLVITHFCKQALADNKLLPVNDNDIPTQSLVSAGNNCAPQQLCIVDPESLQQLPEGGIGEIWLSGAHIADGYWQQPEKTAATFNAFTASGEGPFLRTGDLAGVIDNELFVTGRLKDVLIIRGKNHYPQDIESTAANADASIHRDGIAAFTLTENQQERLVVVAEILRSARKDFDADKVAEHIQQAIAKEHGIDTYAIEFIRFASLAKTSSGKIQRFLVKQQFSEGSLKSAARWQAISKQRSFTFSSPLDFNTVTMPQIRDEIIATLQKGLACKLSELSETTPLDTLGLDSIEWLQLCADLERWSNKTIDAALVWQLKDINSLTRHVFDLKKQATQTKTDEIEGFI